MNETEMVEIVKKHVIMLNEHFPNVQINVSRVDNKGFTESVCYGDGDLFARIGLCKAWVEKQHEQIRMSVRSEGLF